MQLLMLLSLLLGLAATGVWGENLAMGKPYELSPAPNYSQCTDPGDATQLTDGQTFGAGWTQVSTVGWAHHARPQATLDLRVVQPIGKVRVHTVGGGHAGVFFPAVTGILVSEDGTSYSLAALIGSGMLDQEGGAQSYAHIMEAADLRARGRYVRPVFQTDERYLFLDEVEVFASPKGVAPKAAGPVTEAALDSLIKRGLTARWLTSEWKDVRKQIQKLAGEGFAGEIEALNGRMAKLDLLDEQAMAEARQEYLLLGVRAEQPVLASGVICQPVDPWSDLRGSTFPLTRSKSSPATDLGLWQDEYESAAVGITNLTDQPQRLTVRVAALKNAAGKTVSWENRLWLRQARPVPTRLGYRVMDALTLLGQGDRNQAQLALPAGECAVLWLTVHSLDLPPGRL